MLDSARAVVVVSTRLVAVGDSTGAVTEDTGELAATVLTLGEASTVDSVAVVATNVVMVDSAGVLTPGLVVGATDVITVISVAVLSAAVVTTISTGRVILDSAGTLAVVSAGGVLVINT